jgi:hypothetical protein
MKKDWDLSDKYVVPGTMILRMYDCTKLVMVVTECQSCYDDIHNLGAIYIIKYRAATSAETAVFNIMEL